MTIAHIFFSFNLGGSELLAIDILNNLEVKSKHLVVINDSFDVDLLDRLNKDVKITLFKRRSGSRSPFHFIRLNYFLWLNKIDIVHCHSETLGLLISKYFLKVLTVHDVGRNLKNVTKFNQVIAISEAVKLDIEKRSNIRPEIILNAVDTNSIRLKLDDNRAETIEIICPARLEHKKKGQDLLIFAIEKVVIYHPNISVTFVGDGDSRDLLEELIRKRGLTSYFCFIGNKNREWLYNNLQSYSLMILPSRYEGFGLVVVEALSAGIPVIVPNIDGPMEIIDGGRFGLSFEVDSSEDLAKVIMKWLDSNEFYSLEARKNSYEIRRMYDIKEYVVKLKQVYYTNWKLRHSR